jgi:hypothetical protein
MICGVFRFSRGRLRRDLPLFFLLIAWAISLIVTVLIGGWKARNIHSMVGMDVCLVIIAVLGLKCDMPLSYDLGLQKGLIAGGVISTIYAIYQQAAVHFGLPLRFPPMNNPSFRLLTENTDRGLRSFATFPEPSMLAAYLIPIAIAMLYLAANQHGTRSIRSWFISMLLFVGLLASGSFSIFISLPIALVLCLFVQGHGLGRLIKASGALISVGILVLLLIATGDWAATLGDGLLGRFLNATEDSSLITRYGLNVASVRVFEENPIFGKGVVPDPDYFFERMPPETTIYQGADTLGGGDSLLLAIASGQGICGLFCFTALVFIAVRRSRQDIFLQSALIGCVVVMTFQCPNFELYLIWVVLGLCLARRPYFPKTGRRPMNLSEAATRANINPGKNYERLRPA